MLDSTSIAYKKPHNKCNWGSLFLKKLNSWHTKKKHNFQNYTHSIYQLGHLRARKLFGKKQSCLHIKPYFHDLDHTCHQSHYIEVVNRIWDLGWFWTPWQYWKNIFGLIMRNFWGNFFQFLWAKKMFNSF